MATVKNRRFNSLANIGSFVNGGKAGPGEAKKGVENPEKNARI
jgi:hypothetical protein